MPKTQGFGKRFVHGFLGEIEITQQANQGRQNPPRISPVQQFDGFTYLLQRRLRHVCRYATFCKRTIWTLPMPRLAHSAR